MKQHKRIPIKSQLGLPAIALGTGPGNSLNNTCMALLMAPATSDGLPMPAQARLIGASEAGRVFCSGQRTSKPPTDWLDFGRHTTTCWYPQPSQ